MLNHGRVALHEGPAQSRSQLVCVLHFGHSEARTVSNRLDKAGHAKDVLHLLLAELVLFPTFHQHTFGHFDAECSEVVVQNVLVEGHCFHQHTAGRVGYVQQLKVALHDSVLARGAVNGDVGVVEKHGFAFFHEREVVFVDAGCVAVVKANVPVLSLDGDDVDIVSLFIEKRIEALCRTYGYVVF